MFPKSRSSAKKHRKQKRKREISLIVEILSDFLKDDHRKKLEKLNILEFGCGEGFQVPYLKKIGNVVATDIYTSDNIKKMKNITFHECSITDTPFADGEFDIIFSNHVIEHIKNLQDAFVELIRIGKPNCIYAFAVPTNIWLLLAIPAQYYNKIRTILKIIFNSETQNLKLVKAVNLNAENRKKPNRWCRLIFPVGHGKVHSRFINCYRTFKIKRWKKLFSDNNFMIQKIQPLLLYGPSEWPIIPTTQIFNTLSVCSSVLFLMKTK